MPTFSDAMATITATPALVHELNDVLMGFTLSTCGKSEKDPDERDVCGRAPPALVQGAGARFKAGAVAKADTQVGGRSRRRRKGPLVSA